MQVMKKMVILLLSSVRIRYWAASWIIKWMAHWEFYRPATAAAPLLKVWLEQLGEITHRQLRRLTLFALMHWFDIVRYHGLQFTTIFSKEIGMNYGFSLFFLFALYNGLSNNRPIKKVEEYKEEIGGFPPYEIDSTRYFINYVTDNQKLKLELVIQKPIYEFGEAVNVVLTIQNLDNTPIILNNRQGATVQLFARSIRKGQKEKLSKLPTDISMRNNQIILPPMKSVTIEWELKLSIKSDYPITAQVYVPHYNKVVELMVSVGHGMDSGKDLTRDFCTL